MSNKLKNRVAIITGSGRGIGRAIALAMAKEGAKVVTNDYDPGFAEAVAKEITDQGGKSMPFRCDVTDFEATRELVQTAVDKFGRLDILVNNAAVWARNLIWDMTEKDWASVMAVHLAGSFNCIRHACGVMKEQKWGRIINTTSNVRLGFSEQCNYCAAKAGIVGLTKAVAMEVSEYGITCNTYGPGATATRSTVNPENEARQLKAYEAGKISKEFYERTKRRQPPEAVPPFLIYLCTDEAADINGQVFYVTGKEIRIYKEEVKNLIVKKEEGFWTLEELVEQVPKVLLKGIESKIYPFS